MKLDLTEGIRSGAIQVSISGDDASVTVRTALKSGDKYRIDAGDANIAFYAVSGGGIFYIHHDDASISSAQRYQILLNREGMSKYRLNDGGATIKMNVDDARITLQ